MDTTEIDGKHYKMTRGEGGKLILEPVKEDKSEREPRCGDIVQTGIKNHIAFVDGAGDWFCWSKYSTCIRCNGSEYKNDLVLGNIFDFGNGDYVKKADVIAALSHEDDDGDCLADRIKECKNRPVFGYNKTYAAFKELGIIKD